MSKLSVSLSMSILLLAAAPAFSQALYSLTDLGILHDSGFSWARGINDSGQVVGESHGAGSPDIPFLWDPTINGLESLSTLGAGGSAWDINNDGQIVGFVKPDVASNDGPTLIGAFWNEGVLTELGDNIRPHAINDAGQVVGIEFGATRAILWEEGSGITFLPDLAGGPNTSIANDINSHDQIAGLGSVADGFTGFRPTYWDNGEIVSISDLHGPARGINDNGQLVGELTAEANSSFSRAYLYDSATGAMTDLGDLPGGRDKSTANAINNDGIVIGSSSASAADGSRVNHAFVWDETNGMRDLNSLLDETGSEWELLVAEDINASGQIVGYGANPEGVWRGFLLTPVPEPSSGVLLLLGLAVAVSTRTKRRR